MPEVKFKKNGRMADNGKPEMPQFNHAVDQVINVSAVCAAAAVDCGHADHVKPKAEINRADLDKKKADGTLQDKKVPELKDMAKALDIKDADGMKKAELVEAIEAAQKEGASE